MKATLKNIISYIQGNLRYKFYYSSYLYVLIPKHIREQIKVRLEIMDKECYNSGSCKLCGCETPHLQMANKACDKPCYPRIMNKSTWSAFNERGAIFLDSTRNTMWMKSHGEVYGHKVKLSKD